MRTQISKRSAFTLVEVMIVVLIIGIIAGVGIPSVVRSLNREGMRKALGDFEQACKSAREGAIFSGKTVEMVFQRADNGSASLSVSGYGGGTDAYGERIENRGSFSATFPEDIEIEAVGLYGLDYTEDFNAGVPVHVKFKSNGTAEDFKIIVYKPDSNDRRGFAVDLVTGRPDIVNDPLTKWR